MKSRIKTYERLLIVGYMIQENNIKGLQAAANMLRANFKLCTKECAGEKIGYLADFNGFKQNNITVADPPEDECLIMSGFKNKDMDMLLTALKNYSISIPLKCVVTRHNQSWELYKLIEELKKEHEQMSKSKK